MTKVIRIGIASEQAGPELVDAFCAAMANVAGTFGDREARALELGNELARRWIERDLQAQADSFADEVVLDGQRYARQQRGTCRYHTLAGPVVVGRESFRLVEMHNGPTVVPLEVRAGLLERATPALAFSVT